MLKKSLIPARTTTYREARAYNFVDFRSNHACSHLLGGLCAAGAPAVIPVETGIQLVAGQLACPRCKRENCNEKILNLWISAVRSVILRV